jgi:predicted nuclease of predicted toxin-antitoxin system
MLALQTDLRSFEDKDFRQRAFLFGPPPKVIWLDVGNAGTNAREDILRRLTFLARRRPPLEV